MTTDDTQPGLRPRWHARRAEGQGRLVLHGRHRPVLVVHDRGRVFALDNRCPHMGFPLDRGSVEDGILTCHWHHARFDLASGCTFDLWADDVPTCPVEVRDGEVWVKPSFGHADAGRPLAPAARGRPGPQPRARDRQGRAGPAHGRACRAAEILRQAALFGARNRDGWGVGAHHPDRARQPAGHAAGGGDPTSPSSTAAGGSRPTATASRRGGSAPRSPSRPDPATLKRWLRHWVAVRHRDGGRAHPADRDRGWRAAGRAGRPAARGGDGPRLRRRRPRARLRQQGVASAST